jgi:hypothetical protein
VSGLYFDYDPLQTQGDRREQIDVPDRIRRERRALGAGQAGRIPRSVASSRDASTCCSRLCRTASYDRSST